MDSLHILLMTIAVSVATSRSSAIPQSEEQKKRVIDRPVSDEEHFSDNEDGPHHNLEYDHEAFLGKEEQKTFDQLTPEESKERLGLIYYKIDKDGDGQVSEAELVAWIQHVQLRYVDSDTDRQWQDHLPEGDDKALLSWDVYMERTYGHIDDGDDEMGKGTEEENDRYDYRYMVNRDKRRWAKADQNSDGLLTKAEFSDFLHPEEVDHMKDVVIDETVEDIDKNKDGLISLDEYIGDMWTRKDDGDEEPDWVTEERNQFTSFRDKNNDGFMDRDEIKDWIIPDDYNHAESEAKHLIHESDGNRDGSLSKDEVLEKYDLFVGSQATDFGEALTKHDEF